MIRLPRRFPGVPRKAWPALIKMAKAIENLCNMTTDGVNFECSSSGAAISVDEPYEFDAVILGGSQPYAWRQLFPLNQYATLETPPTVNTSAGILSSMSGQVNGVNGVTQNFRPLWEKNGRRDVLPGSIVRVKFLSVETGTGGEGESFWFDYEDYWVAAQVTIAGTSTTTLNGAITATATSIITSSATSFPGRDQWKIQIDSEVMLVTSGSGTTSLTVTRGVDGTFAAAHANGATVTLVAVYAWTEQVPDAPYTLEWQNQTAPRSGTQLAEPAIDRNFNAFVPDQTQVILRRRMGLGSANTTIYTYTGDTGIDSQTTSIIAVAVDSFPSVYPFYILVEGEYMRVTAASGTSGKQTLTVVRGCFGSAPTYHDPGAGIYEVLCQWVFDYPNPQNTIVNTESGFISTWAFAPPTRVVPPQTYNYYGNFQSVDESFKFMQKPWLWTTPAGQVVQATNKVTISSNTNNQDVGNCSWLQLNVTTAANLTGLAIAKVGTLVELTNIGSGTLTLKNSSGSSTYPFLNSTGADLTLSPNQSVWMKFDGTNWRDIGGNIYVSSGSGVTGSGTSTHLSKWTGTSSIGNSSITDSGSSIAMNLKTFFPSSFSSGAGINLGAGSSAPTLPQNGDLWILSGDDGFYWEANGSVHRAVWTDTNGTAHFIASTTSGASLNIPLGVRPTSPNAGDVYIDSTTDLLGWYTGTFWEYPIIGANVSTFNVSSGGFLDFALQNANLVAVGPVTGGLATPNFRLLQVPDLPGAARLNIFQGRF